MEKRERDRVDEKSSAIASSVMVCCPFSCGWDTTYHGRLNMRGMVPAAFASRRVRKVVGK